MLLSYTVVSLVAEKISCRRASLMYNNENNKLVLNRQGLKMRKWHVVQKDNCMKFI